MLFYIFTVNKKICFNVLHWYNTEKNMFLLFCIKAVHKKTCFYVFAFIQYTKRYFSARCLSSVIDASELTRKVPSITIGCLKAKKWQKIRKQLLFKTIFWSICFLSSVSSGRCWQVWLQNSITNDHLRIVTTYQQQPPFWSPNFSFYNTNIPILSHIGLSLHKWTLNNDHLWTTATNLRPWWWSLYTGLTVLPTSYTISWDFQLNLATLRLKRVFSF